MNVNLQGWLGANNETNKLSDVRDAKNKGKEKLLPKSKKEGMGEDWKLNKESYTPSGDGIDKLVSWDKTKSDALKKAISEAQSDTAQVESANTPKLSKAASALLDKLKEKYKNMDFFVENYSSDEEASSILNRGTKEFSVLIEPETLEKMASDPETLAKYESVLDGAGDTVEKIREELGDENAENLQSVGFSFDDDGKMSFFATISESLDGIAEKRQESIDKAKEAKEAKEAKKAKEAKEAKKAKEESTGKVKDEDAEDKINSDAKEAAKTEVLVADSIEGLIEKLKLKIGRSDNDGHDHDPENIG